MYHDTIHINFKNSDYKDIVFNYSFFISKNLKEKFSQIKYSDILQKFTDIGFNIKYLKFYDIDDDEIVYCSYNYQSNFNIFFSAYEKIFKNKNFNISFEYGNIFSGVFYPNNMNFFAGIVFITQTVGVLSGKIISRYPETIINGKTHEKIIETYQIRDKNGEVISSETTSGDIDFEQHFFEKYEVKVALRKYKLNRLREQYE